MSPSPKRGRGTRNNRNRCKSVMKAKPKQNNPAGYSGTPLVKKLGIKPRHRVTLLHAPTDAEALLEGLPDDVRLTHGLRGKAMFDVILLFCKNESIFLKAFPKAKDRLVANGGLWVAWPKKASGIVTDIDEGKVRAFGLLNGLVDNKICAVDATWSGLRFVVRLAARNK